MRIEAYAAKEGFGSRLIVDGLDVTDKTRSLKVKVEVDKATEVIWETIEGVRAHELIIEAHNARPDELVVTVPDVD